MRWLAATIGVLLLSATAHAGGYAVLSGVDEDDPYYAAAKRLAKHHGTKHLLRFDPGAPEKVLAELRTIAPEHVAFVLRPEQIDVNSVRRILRMTTQVDADPFVDFGFGYITGGTAKEATQFVENIIRAGKAPRPREIASAAVWGGSGRSRAADDVLELGVLRLPRRSLRFVAPAGKDRDQGFIDAELASLGGRGAIIMGGHGMPWEIGHGPRAEDIGKLDLFPAVAFNYACHTGVTLRYPEREYKGRTIVERYRQVEAKRSFALNIIRSGVTGYVAYVNPRPAGPELTTDFERVLAGASLGESRRTDYAKILLGYLGFGEVGIVPPPWTDGHEKGRSDVDPVRHMMLDGATGGILYGDPALRPYPPTEHALPLTTTVARTGDAFAITLGMPERAQGTWCADPFRRFDVPGGKQGMARKIYAAIALPDDAPPIRGVWIEEAKQGGTRLPTLSPVWAVEQNRGHRILHLKANFPYGGRGALIVRLQASPRLAPPDLGDPQACLSYAREVAEQVIAGAANPELDGAVYDGAAGIAAFLFDLAAATQERRWRDAADGLLERAQALKDKPGLYTGLAGLGQVCLDAWWSTDDAAYLAKAVEVAGRIGAPQGPDVISGAAGTGIFFLNLHAATKEARWLAEAAKRGDYLAQHATQEEGQARWILPGTPERTYLGFSHGAAGIGYFLLQLHFAGGEKRFGDLARQAAAYVWAEAASDGHDGWQWSKMAPPAKPDVRLQWCHGSPGIGLFFHAMHEGLGGRAYADALRRCLAATRRAGRIARANGCQCHGLSGNAELLIEVHRTTGDIEPLLTARAWAQDLLDEAGVKQKVAGRAYGPGYMTGLAGIGHFFLRLADPQATRLPMMVRDPGPSQASVGALVKKVNDAARDHRTDIGALLDSLRKAGPEAFTAVVALIEQGEGHWRTFLLLQATKQDGGERELMRLADGPALPRSGRWTALSGLGIFDTPLVRGYLLKRIATERDAGLFMSTATALGTLKEPRAHDPIASQLLKFEERWSGVETHLIRALVMIDDAKLIGTLEEFANDERALRTPNVASAVMQIASRDPVAGRRAARKLLASKHFAKLGPAWRAQIEQAAGAK